MQITFTRSFRGHKIGSTFDAEPETAREWIAQGIAVEAMAMDAPPRNKAMKREHVQRKGIRGRAEPTATVASTAASAGPSDDGGAP